MAEGRRGARVVDKNETAIVNNCSRLQSGLPRDDIAWGPLRSAMVICSNFKLSVFIIPRGVCARMNNHGARFRVLGRTDTCTISLNEQVRSYSCTLAHGECCTRKCTHPHVC